jgi:NitT/TauT family transport system permease protein
MSAGNLFLPYTPVRPHWARLLVAVQAAAALALWAASGLKGLPTPLEVVGAWFDLLLHHDLLQELWTSVKTSLLALVLSTVAGVSMAALGTAPVFHPLARVSSALRFLGFVGLSYVFMLVSPGGQGLRVALLAFGMFVFLVTGLLAEIAALPRDQVDHCRTLGMKHWRITAELVLLAKADVTLDLVRQNAAVGWTLLTLVEGLTRAQGGIGALLLNQNRYFLLAGVFAIQLTILAYGLLQDALLVQLKHVLCPYARLGKEQGAAS